MSAILNETRTVQWPLKVRIAPTVAAVLAAYKPDTVDKGDYLVNSTVKNLLVCLIERDEFRRAHHVLATLIASDLNHASPQAGHAAPFGKEALR